MPMSARDRWLLALAYPPGPSAVLPARRLGATELAELFARADLHGVLPAVVANARSVAGRLGPERLTRSARPGPAEAIETALRGATERLVLRAVQVLHLRRQTEEACGAFAQAGVPHLVLKGAEFADRLYDPPALRTFTDVDLLVPAARVEDAHRVMRSLGYAPLESGKKHEAGYAECAWRRPAHRGGAVEVHWNLVNSPALRRGLSVSYEDLACRGDGRATPAALLLIAAVHGAASHAFDRLGPLCDLALAARGAAGEVDVAWLGSGVQRTGAGLALTAGLKLAGELFGEPACAALARQLRLPARWLWRACLTPGMVLRSHAKRDSFRRQAFRQMLKGL
jgi:hypothetical protein